MAAQYKRTYELSIDREDGSFKVIRDLRIKFEITKSLHGYPNLCKLELFNPNDDTLSLLEKKFTKLSLNAGYLGNVGLIFTGEVKNAYSGKFGVDRVVTLYAGDGARSWRNASYNRTLSENVSVRSAIDDVMRTFEGVSVGVIDGVPDISDKLRGQTLTGSSKDIMDTYASEYGFDWSIQDGEMVITPIGQPLQDDEAVLVNASTGMLGSPTITEFGANVTTLLNPKMLPNRAFKLESVSVNVELGDLFFRENLKSTRGEGVYKIEEVVFMGDSHADQWTSKCIGRLVRG